MKRIKNATEGQIIEMPKGERLMPGEAFEADAACLANPGVKILLAGGKLAFVSSLAPSKALVLSSIDGAKEEAELHGIAQAAELAGLQADPDVLRAFESKVRALRGEAPPPPPDPNLPAPPPTRPERP